MRILRREPCTGAAIDHRVTDNEFARRNDCSISGRPFWLAVALALTICASPSAQAASYIGRTAINASTLTVADSSGSGLGSTSSIIVNSSGTLLFGASNQIDNNATMTLAGGTFAKGSYDEVGIGALTLTPTGSHIDFETGTVGVLSFTSFNPGANTLAIPSTGFAAALVAMAIGWCRLRKRAKRFCARSRSREMPFPQKAVVD
jgi:hypothetical protein